MPGNTTSHHIERLLRASFRIEPQLADGGGGPNPRNESELSVRIAEAMPNVIGTRIGARALGRMWRSMIRTGPAPTDRAAVTNSLCRSLRNSPRVSRAMPVQPVAPMIAMVCQIVGFSKSAMIARMSTSVGTHITISVTRLVSMSIQPPK